MTYFYVFWAKEPDSEIRMQISLKLPKIEKWRFLQTLTPYELLNRKWNRKLKGSSQCAFRYATFQFLFRCPSLNINRVIAIWKFWGFCDLVNSTFDLPSRKTIHIISGQGYNWWCRLVKISQSVRELSRSERTHRQTDTQTVKRTYLPKMKFWQVMKEQSHTWLPDVPKLLLNDIVLTYTL